MPGQPKTRALVAHLAEPVDDEPRVQAVLALLEGGEILEEIAAGLRVPYEGGVWTPDRRTLNRVLLEHYETEYREAQRACAGADADRGLKALKTAPETREGIAKARELASMYRWLAGKRDPATYGDAPAVAVQVNNPGSLFLQAVARPGALPPAPPKKKIESGDARGVGTAHSDESKDDAEP